MTWADSDYSYKKEITIQNEKVAGDETDFPVLVSITDSDLADTSNGGHVESSSGYDIVFYNDDEDTKLDHEIEQYTNTNGTLVFWVKIESLSGSNDTVFYIYYGKAGVSSDPSTTNTWHSDYEAVWHMDSSGTNVPDSTSNSHDGTKNDSSNPSETTSGKMGNAQDFGGASDNYINTNSTFQSTFRGSHNITFFVKPDDGVPSAPNSSIGYRDTASENRVNLETPRLNSGKLGWFYESDNNQARCSTNDEHFSNGQEDWHMVSFDADSTSTGAGQHKIYFDGDNKALDGSDDGDNTGVTYNSYTTSEELFIGMYNEYGEGPIQQYYGLIDEVRISNDYRSSNYILTDYNTQNNPSSFMEFGSEQEQDTGPSDCNVSGDIAINTTNYGNELYIQVTNYGNELRKYTTCG